MAYDMGSMPRTSLAAVRSLARTPARMYLVSGSFAYDTVLHHPQAFRQRILPEVIDKLNVSFDVAAVGEAFGGCAGNIAYSAALLGDEPMLVGNLGADGDRYLQRLQHLGLDTTTLGVIPVLPTAHAWMLTDATGNQIISFHSGAMSAPVRLPYAPPALWHIAPEDPVNMLTLARAARASGVEYFFDPGQCLPVLLEGAGEHVESLLPVLQDATGIFLNDYEFELLAARYDIRRLLTKPEQFIVRTRGSAGVELLHEGRACTMPVAEAEAVVDPTGCGDAFRAGFLHAYTRGRSLHACVGLGAVMGALAVGAHGGQGHHATAEEVYARARTYNRTATIEYMD
ncbi:carbohydrate kinase family protein [Paraburkholderia sp. EG287A]|uniref:carbohydrate kinase family protein n=1 Tax=Paraburkholderia sp. EG287A TaxID=3237012 RepID=UPI0034D37962